MLFGTANYLRVWWYDIRRTKKIQTSQPDVFGSVSVGMFCVPAHLANKEIPGPSICPFSVQTLRDTRMATDVIFVHTPSEVTAQSQIIVAWEDVLLSQPHVRGVWGIVRQARLQAVMSMVPVAA